MEVQNEFEMGTEINKKYKLLKKIGEGSFGFVFKAINMQRGNLIAIKFEHYHAKSKLLKKEAQIYKYLEGGPGIPNIKWFGIYEGKDLESSYRYMAFDLLGHSLKDTMEMFPQHILSPEMVCIYAKEICKIIHFIHSKGYVHRDIKPENFLKGMSEPSSMNIIDFGLSKRYLDDDNNHIKSKLHNQITGTIRYISLHIHEGFTPSRRDDLISMGYMFMYLLHGNLPWQKLSPHLSNKEKIDAIYEMKLKMRSDKIIANHLLEKYMKYVYSLEYTETPNYTYLISLFTTYEVSLLSTTSSGGTK